MSELARRVGLGLAARGDVADIVAWADRARERGLESVWFHDSYFERDAVTYATAVASRVPDVRVGLGALNPFTRHPVLIAMTVSALDEIAPGRIALALGSALPLRLGQMGIPYTPDEGVARVSEAIDTVRKLWNGERLPPAKPGLPPLQPMFPPVHRVPIFVAGYRTPMMVLAGQKADGYIARPAESITGFRTLVGRMRKAARAAGRDPDALETTGYLLTFVDKTRREALNRAKREPFVIYMMAILSDVTLRRAGFETALRDRIAAAWRAEDYHTAAQLLPDELLDAFILCGTREEVAARALEYHEAGMTVPLLQPVVQDEEQTVAAIETARLYGEGRALATGRAALQAQRLGAVDRVARRAAAWYEIVRPFSFTASTVPVMAGAAIAAWNGAFSWPLYLAAQVGAIALHAGTNTVNEVYDVRKGVDSITSPRASQAIVKGRILEREALLLASGLFALAALIGAALIAVRGWPVAALGLAGLAAGYFYTAPPFEFKFRSLGLPFVFLMFGPLMVVGSYYVLTGGFDPVTLVVSVPVGLLVMAILHGNEWRDIGDDARVGGKTASIVFGRRFAYYGYVGLVVGAYVVLSLAVALGVLPTSTLLAMLSLPLLVRAIRASELGAAGQQRAIAMIDLETAQLHAAFGFLLVAGLVVAAFVR
jgi:1,4-dihydroxy-2-naphthoate octaprenyltransferase